MRVRGEFQMVGTRQTSASLSKSKNLFLDPLLPTNLEGWDSMGMPCRGAGHAGKIRRNSRRGGYSFIGTKLIDVNARTFSRTNLGKAIEARLHTAVSSGLVYSMISVHRFEDLIVPRFFWLLFLLQES